MTILNGEHSSPVQVSPRKANQWYHRYAGSVILKVVYGYDTLEVNDPMIALAHEGISYVESGTKSGYLIELIPWSNN